MNTLSINSVCNRLLWNAHGWKDVLKVEYNDPHKFASKLRGFYFTVRTNSGQPFKNLTPIMADRVSRRGKRIENRAISRHACVDHCIQHLQYLSTHMHFITNGYKRFSKTNSTDPRQRVPLIRTFDAIVRRFISPKVHWSDGSLVRRFSSPKV